MPKIPFTHRALVELQPAAKRIEYFDTLKSELNLALRISPAGSKVFFQHFYSPATRSTKRLTLGRFPALSLSDARKMAAANYSKIAAGRDLVQERKKEIERQAMEAQKVLTVEDLAALFFDKHLPKLRKNTRRSYEATISNHITPMFGRDRVKDLNRVKVKGYLDKLTPSHPAAANQTLVVFKAMLNFGISEDFIQSNPLAGLKAPAPKQARERVCTPAELRKVWDAADGLAEPFSTLIKVLILTGQRVTETSLTKWQHVDFESGIWIIPAENAKNKKAHSLPLPDAVRSLLAGLRPLNGSKEYIFESTIGTGRPIVDTGAKMRAICKAAGIDNVTPHDLRRTFATGMAYLGVDMPVLKKLLNHTPSASQDITAAVYNRYQYEDEKREALNRWCDFVLSLDESAKKWNR